MRVNLQCPYSEKDEAKALGARWDAARKTWYVVDPDDLSKFARWIAGLSPKTMPSEKKRPVFSGRGPLVTVGAGYVDIAHPAGLLPWEDEDPPELIRLIREIGAH